MSFSTMLYYAARYQINIVYGLSFLGFIGMGLSAWLSFRILNGLVLTTSPAAPPSHAGTTMDFEFKIEELRGRPRRHIIVTVGNNQYEVSIEAKGQLTFKMNVPCTERGRLLAPMVHVSTPHPFGIWSTHCRWNPKQSGVVFPEIEPDAPKFTGALDSIHLDQTSGKLASDGDSLVGVRNFQSGDSLRRVAWKIYAKTDGQVLATKQGEAGLSTLDDLWINEASVQSLSNKEDKLRRLSAWLLQAHETGHPYGLNFSGTRIEPAIGQPHLHQCLEILALSDGYAKRVGCEKNKDEGLRTSVISDSKQLFHSAMTDMRNRWSR